MSAIEIGAVRASASLDSAGIGTGVKDARSHLRLLQGGFQQTSREALRAAEATGRAWDEGLSKSAKAAKNQIEALTGLDRASKATSATTKSWVAQLNRQAQSFDRLRSSVDPLFASTKQYEAAVEQAERAVRTGIVSQEEANRVLDKAAQKYLGLVPAAQQAAEAQKKAEQATRTAKEAYERTRASLDPLYASSKQYESIVEQINAAVKAGAVTQAEASLVVDKAAARYLEAGTAAATYGASAKVSTFQTANLAAQFNDIGVMLAAGQSPLLLAVQQGTQISQVLNQMGGKTDILRGLSAGFLSMINPVSLATIAIIAGGAALFQWGASAFGAGEDADTLKERVEDLEAALSDVDRQLELSEKSFGDLRAEFFGTEEGIRSLIAATSELSLRKLADDADTLRSSLASMYDGNPWLNVSRVEQLQTAFALFREDTRALAQDIEAVGAATGLEKQLEATRHLRSHFVEMAGDVGKMSKSQLEFFSAIVETEKALSRALAKIREVEGANDAATQAMIRAHKLYGETRNEANALAREIGYAEANALALAGIDITSGVSSAAKEAASLAANLGISLNAAINLQNLQGSKEYSGRGGDPRKLADAAYQQALGYETVDQIIKELTKSTKNLGSATQSNLAALQQDIEQRKKLLGLTGDQRTKYLALIQVQSRLGKDADKYSKAKIEALADELVGLEKLEEGYSRLQEVQGDLADLVADALFDPDSATDAAKDYVKQIASEFARSQFIMP
ncbi:MAG: phage tail length tape measure family protein, partial [Leisingera sp.]